MRDKLTMPDNESILTENGFLTLLTTNERNIALFEIELTSLKIINCYNTAKKDNELHIFCALTDSLLTEALYMTMYNGSYMVNNSSNHILYKISMDFSHPELPTLHDNFFKYYLKASFEKNLKKNLIISISFFLKTLLKKHKLLQSEYLCSLEQLHQSTLVECIEHVKNFQIRFLNKLSPIYEERNDVQEEEKEEDSTPHQINTKIDQNSPKPHPQPTQSPKHCTALFYSLTQRFMTTFRSLSTVVPTTSQNDENLISRIASSNNHG